MPTDPPTPTDPLVRADIRVINDSELEPRSITGPDFAQPIELPPRTTMILASGKQAQALEIKVPTELPEPIRALKAVPLRVPSSAGAPVRFTRDQLANLAPDEPLIVENIGSTVDLSVFKEVAGQAADADRRLIIIVRDDDE